MGLGDASRRQLAAGGWFEGRSCDVEPFKKAYRDERYVIFPAALQFLEQFGGLAGNHRAMQHTNPLKHFTFDARKAAENIPKEKVDVYSVRFGEALIPVGEIDDGYITLMISEHGALVGGLDNYLWLLGNTVDEGLNAIFETHQFKELAALPSKTT
jgi:hypothetical protein